MGRHAARAHPIGSGLPGTPFTTYHPADFAVAFAQDGSLDKVSVFNLLLTPGVWDHQVVSESIAFAERKRAFVILDPPADAVADPTGFPLPMVGDIMSGLVPGESIPKSQNGALYFPYLRSNDPRSGYPITVAPSGFVAGAFARKTSTAASGRRPPGTDDHQRHEQRRGQRADDRPPPGTLNPIGVNCVRTSGDRDRHIRRPDAGHGQPVVRGIQVRPGAPDGAVPRAVAVREPGLGGPRAQRTPLWVAIRTTIENFMLGLFHQGAFQGSTPSQAFQVLCDDTTTTPDDQANGIVNVVVAFSPLKPAEFVVIKLAQLAGQP